MDTKIVNSDEITEALAASLIDWTHEELNALIANATSVVQSESQPMAVRELMMLTGLAAVEICFTDRWGTGRGFDEAQYDRHWKELRLDRPTAN